MPFIECDLCNGQGVVEVPCGRSGYPADEPCRLCDGTGYLPYAGWRDAVDESTAVA